MAKHTPGPWEVEIVKSEKDEVYARIKGVAFTDGIKVGVYKKKLPEEALANADLIAAAPELLEACKEALIDLQFLKDYIPKHSNSIKRLKEAIAKVIRPERHLK